MLVADGTSSKPQSTVRRGMAHGDIRRDGRAYTWKGAARKTGQTIHLTVDRYLSLPVMTLCGLHAYGDWRMSVKRPVPAILCIDCRRMSGDRG